MEGREEEEKEKERERKNARVMFCFFIVYFSSMMRFFSVCKRKGRKRGRKDLESDFGS